MGKVEINKQNKRSSLLRSAYELFTDRGFAKTTIADIAQRSGLAKGTFYLYFKDKYDLRDDLVARKSAQLLLEAHQSIQNAKGAVPDTLEAYLTAMIDYILSSLQENHMLLRFISKNLSWGFFRRAVKTEGKAEYADLSEFYQLYLSLLDSSPDLECSDPEILLFMIIELVNSTCYSCILYETPAPLEEYLPHLHRAIHQLLEGYAKPSSSRQD